MANKGKVATAQEVETYIKEGDQLCDAADDYSKEQGSAVRTLETLVEKANEE
jgi:hypothetical protein